jgi:tripartite-type tricarboxylate transporter receptor subunit TctC
VIRLVSLVLLAVMTGAAAAQTPAPSWPDRPVRVIIPFPAGSSSDVVGRILVQKLGVKLGQQLVVENRVGASGNIGTDAIAKAAPDGYTIGIVTGSTQSVAPTLSPKLPYDPLKDFTPITLIGDSPYVLVVYPGVPAKSVTELIALAKAKPGALNYGSAGQASLAHLASALFATTAGIDITHVPYKSSAQSMVDMMGGRLEMQFATIAPVLSNINSGQLRALATTGTRRVAALPDVTTMAEAGVAGYEASLWMAFVMPAGVPEPIVTRLNSELTTIMKDKETIAAMQAQGFEPDPSTPQGVLDRTRSEIAKWKDVIAKAGIKAPE